MKNCKGIWAHCWYHWKLGFNEYDLKKNRHKM